MNIHTIVFSLTCGENIEESEFLNLLKKRFNSYQSKQPLATAEALYYATVLPCCLENAEADTCRQDWIKLEGKTSYKTHTDLCLKCVKKQDASTGNVVDKLLHLAESLPKLGTYVNVVWVENDAWPDVDSNFELYGALKCLLEWHHAVLDFVSVEGEVFGLEAWVEVLPIDTSCLRGQESSSEEENAKILWRGGLKIKSAQCMNPLTLPGFSLHPYVEEKVVRLTINKGREDKQDQEDCLLSPYLDLIAPLDLREIPTFYISSQPFTVKVSDNSHPSFVKSRQFLSLLQENHKLCYLVRLQYGTSWAESRDSCFLNSRASWVDLVRENVNSVHESPYRCELTGQTGHHQYLLCADSDSTILAHPIQRLDNIDPAPFHDLAMKELQGVYSKVGLGDEDEAVTALLEELPHLSAHTFLHLNTQVEKLQVAVLSEWIAEKQKQSETTEIDAGELSLLLSATREWYINRMLHDADFMKMCAPQPQKKLRVLCTPRPEYENNFELLERLVLQCRNVTADKLARLKSKSNDSLGGLSPPTKGKIITLDATQFIKAFKSDGTARREGKSTVVLKKNPSCKYDNGEAKDLSWSDESVPSDYHDVYYHRGAITEKLEDKSDRLKARLLHMETSSTCNLEQVQSPASITLSPPRAVTGSKKQSGLAESPSPGKTARKNVARSGSSKCSPRKKALQGEDRAGRKRRREADDVSTQAKRKDKAEGSEDSSKATSAENSKPQQKSRAQKNKQKLMDVINRTLEGQGVKKGDKIYKPCFNKLYTITYTFVKDLRNYNSLSEEMRKIAESQVQSVVMFVQSQKK